MPYLNWKYNLNVRFYFIFLMNYAYRVQQQLLYYKETLYWLLEMI